MKHLYLSFTICIVLMKGLSCDTKWRYRNDDTIYFKPDETTQHQMRPITNEETNNYNLQVQAVNKNPVQYFETAGKWQTTRRPAVQYTSTPETVNSFQNPTAANQYILNSERPTNNGQQYASTNDQASTFEDKSLVQATILQSQGVNVSAAVGEFGINVFQIANQRNNLVLSPYSVTTLLALLQQGASGETLQQISNALQMPADVAATAYKQLTNSLRSRDVRHNILNVANAAFISNTFQLNSNFKNKATDNFGCEVNPLNFFDSYGAVRTINKWVSTSTNNKISQLLAPESVSGNTQLVLVNTLVFKGVWQLKFREEATLPRDFKVAGQGTKSIPFMRARRYYRYGEDKSSHLQVIVLPFENQEYSLMVLLPSPKSTLAEMLRSLTYAKLAEYHNFAPQDVELELPKFTVRSDTDLRPLLREMGVTKMFDANSELLRLVNSGNIAPQVSSAVHSAMLSIDEQGGTAAAATAFTVVALSYSSPDAVFKANRPFLAVLWDTKQALPLIMAKITDPTL